MLRNTAIRKLFSFTNIYQEYFLHLNYCKYIQYTKCNMISLYCQIVIAILSWFFFGGVHVAHLFIFLCWPIYVYLVTSTTNVIVFRLNRPGLEPKSYCTGCVHAIITFSSRFVSCELHPFVIAYAMTLHPWKRILHGWTPRRKNVFCRSNALIPCSFCDSKINIIVLINGFLHNGPVICPRLVMNTRNLQLYVLAKQTIF